MDGEHETIVGRLQNPHRQMVTSPLV